MSLPFRCPYCRLPGMMREYRDGWTGELLRDVRNHNCPDFAPVPALTIKPTDTSFINEARNSVEGLAAYLEALK
jgi:hypothetical protein